MIAAGPHAASERRMVTLRDGRRIVVRAFVPADAADVSLMVRDNFLHAASFSRLDAVARAAYLEANSVAGVLDASIHPDNICCLVAVDADDGTVKGYRLVRRGVHRVDGAVVAEGKRLHVARAVAGLGLGAELVRLSAAIAQRQGYARITAQASGESRYFFERLGYHCVLERADNRALRARRIASFVAYLEMALQSPES